MNRLKWKLADPIPQCSAGVFVCLSLLPWFTDTDLAEPILLVILCWIQAHGDPEEPSTLAASSSSLGYSRQERIFTLRCICSSVKTTRGLLVQRRKRWKAPRLRRFLSSHCTLAATLDLRQTDILPHSCIHGGWWQSFIEHDVSCLQPFASKSF